MLLSKWLRTTFSDEMKKMYVTKLETTVWGMLRLTSQETAA